MKKTASRQARRTRDILPEYNFTGGKRGKHYLAYRRGHKVIIKQTNGSLAIQYFTLKDGAVMLEPDVRDFFPDAQAVNSALRALIKLVPRKRPKAATHRRNAARV